MGRSVGGQQLADVRLHGAVAALSEVVGAYLPAGIDEVLGRPVLVAVGVPGAVVVVHRDRVVDPQRARLAAHVGHDVLEGELRGVDADDDQAVLLVFVVPALDVGQ
jgi:hypothetical protein